MSNVNKRSVYIISVILFHMAVNAHAMELGGLNKKAQQNKENPHEDVSEQFVDDNAQRCLHLTTALGRRNVSAAKYILEDGGPFDFESKPGRKIWQAVSVSRSSEFVSLLLEHGASPNALFPAKDGAPNFTPLNLAFGLGDLRITRLLLDRGAECNVVVGPGKTVLFRCIDFLIDEDNDGWDIADCLEAFRLILQNARFSPQKEVTNLSRQRIFTTLLVLERARLPKEVQCKVLACLTDDVCSARQLGHVIFDSSLEALITRYPFAWFKTVYDRLPDTKKK